MTDKQGAMLIKTNSMAQKTCFLERGLGVDLAKDAYSRADQTGL